MVCLIDEDNGTCEMYQTTGTEIERTEAALKQLTEKLPKQGKLYLSKHYATEKLIVISFERVK